MLVQRRKKSLSSAKGILSEPRHCVNRNIQDRNKKQYILETKQKNVEYDKVYREEHKEKLRQRNKDIYGRSAGYVCPCGTTLNYTNKSHHTKSKTHRVQEHRQQALTKEPEPETP